MGKSGEKYEKLEKVEKVAKMLKSGGKWGKVGKVGKSSENPKITFDRISRHFRSIRNFYFLIFFSKWPPAAILEIPFGPFWMTENHFRSHFSPFQINTQLFFF